MGIPISPEEVEEQQRVSCTKGVPRHQQKGAGSKQFAFSESSLHLVSLHCATFCPGPPAPASAACRAVAHDTGGLHTARHVQAALLAAPHHGL